jgi:hypothetical protein
MVTLGTSDNSSVVIATDPIAPIINPLANVPSANDGSAAQIATTVGATGHKNLIFLALIGVAYFFLRKRA